MTQRDYLKISKAKIDLVKATNLIKAKNWTEEELLLFTDLRQRCNLFDYEMEQAASKLPDYKH